MYKLLTLILSRGKPLQPPYDPLLFIIFIIFIMQGRRGATPTKKLKRISIFIFRKWIPSLFKPALVRITRDMRP